MNEFENRCTHNLAETCVESITVAELLELTGHLHSSIEEILPFKLTYGAIEGSGRLRSAIAALYATQSSGNILVTHGTISANALVHQTLVSLGDRVVAVVPTYQQHYSIPESIGAEVKQVTLRPENSFLPDLDELRAAVTQETKLIAITNPNNPTGSLMQRELLEEVVSIARAADAWILCDEVYRGSNQHGSGTTESMADLYEKGISTASMSKVYSMAGLRLGWIAAPQSLIEQLMIHRDYNTISVGLLNDHFACLALESSDVMLQRSRDITRTNLSILSDWVDSEPLMSWVKPKAGTTALLQYDFDISSRDLCVDIIEQTGVMFTPGSALLMEGSIRVGFANNTESLRTGLALVSQYLADKSYLKISQLKSV